MTESEMKALPDGNADEELIALFSQGQMQSLLERSAILLEKYPAYAFGWKAHGLAQLALGRRGEAMPALRRALDLQPRDAEGWTNLGILLLEQEKAQEAEEALRRALAIDRDLSAALSALGVYLVRSRREGEAEPLLLRALSLQPGSPRIHRGLGEIQLRRGELEQAERSFKQELAVQPDDLEVKLLLGQVFHRQGRLGDAAKVFVHITQQCPDHVDAFSSLGLVLQQGGNLPGAEVAMRRVTELLPDSAEAFNNLGNTLQTQGRFIEAQSCYRRALALRPGFYAAHSNLINAMNESERITPQMCLTEARRYGESLSGAGAGPYAEWGCDPAPARLRIGLVSGGLRRGPIAYFTLGVLHALDRSQIEIIAYPTNDSGDELTEAFRAQCDRWQPIRGLDDDAAAARIHADGVHVLIDMAGHGADNRLPVFARKPAPVQVSWPGYFATTGVQQMDWFIGDCVSLPESLRAHFTEQICYLPDTRLCFTPPDDAPDVSELPLLRTAFPTFASFQRLSALSDQTLVLWARVLNSVPSARLRLQAREFAYAPTVAAVRTQLQSCGLDPARVDFHGTSSFADYLAAYRDVDVVLDSISFSSAARACEALWMGVPTVTLAGDSLITRQGAGVLHAAGLDGWIARSVDEYVDLAVRAVSRPAELASLRSGMRDRLTTSALCDAGRFSRALEAAFWRMWEVQAGGRMLERVIDQSTIAGGA
ncbi:tetratricopeptide repeat protein [Pseudothauera lacus]|uniref:protein O-GlcNAc transferase n=1 Tax=Pseudothauera lacus TaxID=2136175 RepID=A0A2T4II04_9RHOO|nr:glycosyltransferase family 41 protein [Pseudothauera lacus]PTD97356.1 hypothetical protein C8261_04955 [Pseudothauera lacus]